MVVGLSKGCISWPGPTADGSVLSSLTYVSDSSKENSLVEMASGRCLGKCEGCRDVSAWTQPHVGKSWKGLAWRHSGPCTCFCLVLSDNEGSGEISETSTGSELTPGADPECCADLDPVSKGTSELLGDTGSASDGASEARVDSNENSENCSERLEEALLESRVCPVAMVILRKDSRDSQERNERWLKD